MSDDEVDPDNMTYEVGPACLAAADLQLSCLGWSLTICAGKCGSSATVLQAASSTLWCMHLK